MAHIPAPEPISHPTLKRSGDTFTRPGLTKRPRVNANDASPLRPASPPDTITEFSTRISIEDIGGAIRVNGGGHADIYLLSHPFAGKLAFKRLRMSGDNAAIEQRRKTAFTEAEIWKTLQHAHVLPFIALLEYDGDLCIVSPYIENGSLSDYLKSQPNADRPRLLLETSAAILFLHSREFIHGDIKASNILVSDDIHALLCDFGLARSVHTSTTNCLKGHGSVPWESPELLDIGEGKTYASDVWAFGMTIYEVLSGRIPFYQKRAISQIIKAILLNDERPPEIPSHSASGVSYAEVWQVASDCWKRNPDERSNIEAAHSRLQAAVVPAVKPPHDTALEHLNELPLSHPEGPSHPATVPSLDLDSHGKANVDAMMEIPPDGTAEPAGKLQPEDQQNLTMKPFVYLKRALTTGQILDNMDLDPPSASDCPEDQSSATTVSTLRISSILSPTVHPLGSLPSIASHSVGRSSPNRSPLAPDERMPTVHSLSSNTPLNGSIFGSELHNSVVLAHCRLEVKGLSDETPISACIPTVVVECMNAIKSHALSSENPNPPPPDSEVLESIRNTFEILPKYGQNFGWERYPTDRIHRLASTTLLEFLNELPIPVVPEDLFTLFALVYRDSERQEHQVTTARFATLTRKLPLSHMYVLLYLMDMLDIMSREKLHTIPDLTRQFAPALFQVSDAMKSKTAIHILESMIKCRGIDATIMGLDHELADRPLHATSPSSDDSSPRPGDMESDDTPGTGQRLEVMDLDDPAASNWPEEQSSAATPLSLALEGVPDITEDVQRCGGIYGYRGGFSQVYPGAYQDPATGEEQEVALRRPMLKYADEIDQWHFLREVEIWFRLKHPNINALLGIFQDNLGHYIVSPWQEQGTVRTCYESRVAFDHFRVLHGIASALDYLHENGCIHGDLKLENVLLSDKGQPLLTDVGFSKKTKVSVATFADLRVACSFPWTSPEILMGGEKSREGDVYAFGMLIAELLLRQPPFLSIDSFEELKMAIMSGERPLRESVELEDAPGYWSTLWDLAERCWQASRNDRPSIRMVLMELDALF